ncbi:MAG TPA: outer membrane beta-barrel protein [Pseudolabrys sp.]|jgi:outer membrane immunogenic protein
MRKFASIVAAGLAVALAQAASAADLPRKAPAYVPPAPPPMTWTGCYIGANIGGAWSRFETDTNFGDLSRSNGGFAGGGQIGCDYQFAGNGLVIGFRNMFDGTTNHRDQTFTLTGATGTADFHNRWFDALTGRIGYSWAPPWLIYFQGGAAWSRVEADFTVVEPGLVTTSSASKTKTGWTVGLGGEYRFTPNWSVFLEGNYYDFGDRDQVIVTPVACPAGCAFNTHAKAATVLVGVNYRFW